MATSSHLRSALLILLCVTCGGCHDGPLYNLKHVKSLLRDEGVEERSKTWVTDFERRKELIALGKKIDSMSPKDQSFWAGHLEGIINTDPSAEMRQLAVLAVSRANVPNALDLIEKGLDDQSLKVRMTSCKVLGRRNEPRAAQMLASTVGTTTDLDVKNSAIAALGKHKGAVPIDSLRIVLEEQDPATVDLAIASLRGVTGKDLGSDPQRWIAALDQDVSPQQEGAIRYASGDPSVIR